MNRFTLEELERMKATQRETLQDVGYIQDYMPVTEFGEELEVWLERTISTPLGVNFRSSTEVHNPNLDMEDTTGTIRLPFDTDINSRDRIRITERHGQITDEILVSVVGSPRKSVSGVVVDFEIIRPGGVR